MLALYNAKMGERSRLDSSVGIGCHFETDEACIFLKSHCFGFYDMAVGRAFTSYAGPYFGQFDALATKKCPERVIGDDHSKVVFFSDTLRIFSKACGKSLEQYKRDCDVTNKLHLIKKPFFFISTIDDPFFG